MNKLKVAIRGGHNEQSVGAEGLVKEVVENRIILESAKKYLVFGGAEVLDVTPGRCSTSVDLAHGVNKANEWGADIFASIHLNKAYSSYNGAIGTEVIVHNANYEIARRVVNNIAALGFKNRGLKEKSSYYEIRNTKMKAMIIETFFCEATDDVALYRNLGADALGKAISEGILGKVIESNDSQIESKPEVKEESKLLKIMKNKVVRSGSKGDYVKMLQSSLTMLGYNVNGIDGHCGPGCVNAIKAYQRDNGLSVDGSCGPATWASILTK